MTRTIIFILSISLSIISCSQNATSKKIEKETTTLSENIPQEAKKSSIVKITKTDEEWKAELTDMEYKVLRKEGTERARTGDLWDHKEDGIYTCRGCALPLFDSSTKFKSGTGWPSYYQPLSDEVIESDTDYKIGYARDEVHCARCNGHLGHVFSDGPEPTGLRFCINSASLDFVGR